MPEEDKKRHAIILGAGASCTSGYPLADKLRLLMSSEKTLREELLGIHKLPEEQIGRIIDQMMSGPMKETVELFRHGCFATVDEFSSLAGPRFPVEVQKLKRLLRFALSLEDPEDDFHKSDYYLLIQKLFQKVGVKVFL